MIKWEKRNPRANKKDRKEWNNLNRSRYAYHYNVRSVSRYQLFVEPGIRRRKRSVKPTAGLESGSMEQSIPVARARLAVRLLCSHPLLPLAPSWGYHPPSFQRLFLSSSPFTFSLPRIRTACIGNATLETLAVSFSLVISGPFAHTHHFKTPEIHAESHWYE